MFEDEKIVTPEEMEEAVFTDDKQTREKANMKLLQKNEGSIC